MNPSPTRSSGAAQVADQRVRRASPPLPGRTGPTELSRESARTKDVTPLAPEATPSNLSAAHSRWATVVEALGGRGNDSGTAVKVSCPLHAGGGNSLQVEVGDLGYPMLHCFGGCAEEWEQNNARWLKRIRKAIVRLGVPESALHPTKGRQAPPQPKTTASCKPAKPLPSDAAVAKWHRRLTDDREMKQHRAFLKKKRGLSKTTIREAGIGRYYRRFTIPVRDASGHLVNVRMYGPSSQGRDKMIGIPGHNSAVIFPMTLLADSGDKPILWCEGELDALLAQQRSEGQYVAATGTGGATNPPKDLSVLKGRTVYLVLDCDDSGRKGSRAHALAMLAAGAKAVHRVDLGLEEDGADITDWFIKHGKSAAALWALCEATPSFDPEDEDSEASAEDVMWLDSVITKPLSWLWRGRIPYGKLTMLEGDPGLGKSTLWVDWVARITTGEPFPGDVGRRNPGRALVIAGEDDLEDTIVPRLMAAGADVGRIATIPLRRGTDGHLVPLVLPDDLNRIRRAIRQNGIKFIVIDPVMAFLSEDINSHNDASTRKALSPLVEMLQKTGAAGVLVRHLNKSGEMQALYRGGGSIAFIGTARSGLVVGKHPEDDNTVVLAQTKTNLSRGVKTLTYSVQKRTDDEDIADTYVGYGDELDLSADDLFGKKDARTNSPERDEARIVLRDLLADGPMLASDVQEAVKGSGISWSTFKRAKESAGVEVYQKRDDKGVILGWMWSTGPAVTIKKAKK